MAKTCVNHQTAPAITMCTQCHKPICQSCTMVTAAGRFCSSECSILHKEFTTKLGAPGRRKGGGGAMKLVFFLLLVVAAVFGVHFAARSNEALKRFDLLGRFMDQEKK